jgi:hypothetical protein
MLRRKGEGALVPWIDRARKTLVAAWRRGQKVEWRAFTEQPVIAPGAAVLIRRLDVWSEDALTQLTLLSKRQDISIVATWRALKASAFLSACAKVGLEALIDGNRLSVRAGRRCPSGQASCLYRG